MSALKEQVGGNHYKKYKIQPAEYAHANNLDFFQGSVVKYITRFRDKNGKQDLEKIKHLCDYLIELEYKDNSKPIIAWGNESSIFAYVVCKKDYNPCKNIEFKKGELYQLKKDEGVMYLLLDGCAFHTTQRVLDEYFEYNVKL